jgi:hypothetical protein
MMARRGLRGTMEQDAALSPPPGLLDRPVEVRRLAVQPGERFTRYPPPISVIMSLITETDESGPKHCSAGLGSFLVAPLSERCVP